MLRLSSESPLFIVLIIISFLVVTFSTWLSSQPFTFRPFGLSDIIQQLTLPLFISLLLERSLEVFITTWRSPFIEELDIEIQRQKIIVDEKLKLAKEQNQQSNIADLKSNRASILPPEGMSLEQQIIQNFIQSQEEVLLVAKPELDDLNTKERQRAAYKADTRTIALWTSLLVGLLISAIGVRSIEPLVITDSNNQIQLVIFRSLDALLTGGLIAGGSEGIHKIIQVFINFMEATSQQIKDNRLP